jgi:hypothetical protein
LRAKERSSFLKKRSKKLLTVLALALPDGLSPHEQKFFGSRWAAPPFFQKRTASFTSKDFRVFAETKYVTQLRICVDFVFETDDSFFRYIVLLTLKGLAV